MSELRESYQNIKKKEEEYTVTKDVYFTVLHALEKTIKKIILDYPELADDILHYHPLGVKVSPYDMHKPNSVRGYVDNFKLFYFSIDKTSPSWSFVKEKFAWFKPWINYDIDINITIDKLRFRKQGKDEMNPNTFRLTEDLSGFVILEKKETNIRPELSDYPMLLEELNLLDIRLTKLLNNKK